MEKLVSIILPTYNGVNHIKVAINSVLSQSYPHFELLVVDDGSTDNTKEIVEILSKNDSRIRYIKNEINLGIQKGLNKGIREAKAEYIARIDDDDEWIDKEKLKKQIEFLESHRDYVLVGTGLVAVDKNGQEIFKHLNTLSDEDIRNKILNKNCFTHSSVLFNKSSALKFGGYTEGVETLHIEDYDLWLKLGTVGKFANLPIYGVKLIIRDEGISSNNKIKQFRRSLRIIRNFRNQYPNYTSAVIFSFTRMTVYRVFKSKYLRNFFPRLYKLYKNI